MKLEKIIKDIKASGFGYLKVELEATLDRPEDSEGWYDTCEHCSGSGYDECSTCDGEGAVDTNTKDDEAEVYESCDDCSGVGNIDCIECEASGEVFNAGDESDFGNVEKCKEFILDSVSTEARDALNYSRFYNDGSVDSEFTFTIPVEKAGVLTEFIDAFTLLSEEIGNGMDVDGAGMHIAVLPTVSGGMYPHSGGLDNERLSNFREEVTKLLPALFISACSGNFTRSLGYRQPQIGFDKYSAIHLVGSSAIEYRLFETCYQRPEAIFEYLGSIAKTLEYYSDTSKKVSTQSKKFAFYDGKGVAGFISDPDQVRIIKKQLKLVVPEGMTIKEFEDNRHIKLSVVEARKKMSSKVTRAKKLYREHVRHYNNTITPDLTDIERSYANDGLRWGNIHMGATNIEIKEFVRRVHMPSMEQYIKENSIGKASREITV